MIIRLHMSLINNFAVDNNGRKEGEEHGNGHKGGKSRN